MTPVRAPDVVSGSLPGLWRGTPTKRVCSKCGSGNIRLSCSYCGDSSFDHKCNDGCRECGGADVLTVDWSDRAAIYLSIAWLADRGHVCAWMLPTTHGGCVEAWDGLSAWEVSAIVVARSVGRVARGLGPVVAILSDWTPYQSVYDRNWLIPSVKRISVNYARYYPDSEARFGGWSVCLPAIGPKHYTGGPETGDAGKLAADRAALADGCVLQVPGGLILPDLGADHV